MGLMEVHPDLKEADEIDDIVCLFLNVYLMLIRSSPTMISSKAISTFGRAHQMWHYGSRVLS